MTGSPFNHHWVTPALAVGGSFAAEAVGALVHKERVTAVVDLRAEACDDIEILRRHGVAHLHLPTRDRAGVCPADLTRGVEFACAYLDRDQRVLIHCEHGIGRAPSLALCVLVARGVPPLAALARLKAKRPAISPSPDQFEAWASWLRVTGAGEAPAFHEFAGIAYQHQSAA